MRRKSISVERVEKDLSEKLSLKTTREFTLTSDHFCVELARRNVDTDLN